MPIMTADTNYSVGPDISINIAGGPTGLVSFSQVTEFESSPETTNFSVIGLDGIKRTAEVINSWKGALTLKRANSNVDDYFAACEAAYFSGGGTYLVTISQVIREPNGGISAWRYEGVALKLDDAGKWSGDKEVEQKISFMASRRKKVV